VFQLLKQIITLPLLFLTLSFLFSTLSHFALGLHKKKHPITTNFTIAYKRDGRTRDIKSQEKEEYGPD
jgi:hypothetical protein